MRNNKGQLVVLVLMLVMVLCCAIPFLVYVVKHDVKWMVKEVKSTRAFHIAEAGIDRGVFTLNGITDGWNKVTEGIIPAGYDGETIYTDITNGQYKIKITSQPEAGYVTIMAVCKDRTTDELRGIKKVYSKTSAQSVLDSGGNMSSGGNFVIHWGPIKARGDIDLSGSAVDRYYPRKYARGNINPRNPPDTDNCEYYVKKTLSNLAEVDLMYYENLAKNYVPQIENGSFTGTTGGYLEGDCTFGPNFRDWNGGIRVNGVNGVGEVPTYYITGNVTLKTGTFIKGNLIVKGNLRFSGNGFANTDDDDDLPNYQVFVPSNAKKEYYHKTGCTHATAQQVWINRGWQNSAQATLSNIIFNGLVYVEGNISSQAGNQTVVGVTIVSGNIENLNGNSEIYYDGDVAEEVEYADQKFNEESWAEFVPGTWSNPTW
ncbi:MAG: hypothetical protein ABID79_04835 [Elusimicrobiota bacterium]